MGAARRFTAICVFGLVAASPAWAGLGDILDFFGKDSKSAGLTEGQAARGLKQALEQGVARAVDVLGRENGFLGNEQVRIPMPEKLELVEKGLRAVGKDALADEFVTSMNRAAEEAVPVAADVFGAAIKEMSVDDAVGIVKGPETAATDYLKRTSTAPLTERFEPIVERAMERVGVTRHYQDVMGAGGSVGRFFGDDSDLDLTRYVTDKALDGVFTMIAAEEQRIRADPAARGTELLKQVFGGR